MKSLRLFTFCLMGLALLSSCSITQRRYNKGFNVEWKLFNRKGEREIVAKRYRQAKPSEHATVPFTDTAAINTIRLNRIPFAYSDAGDDDTIIYYKKPKKKRSSQPAGQADSSSTAVSKAPVRGKMMKEQLDGKRYEKNATAAIVMFFLGFIIFYPLIAAFICAAQSRKYFRTYPDSPLKGRGWANFIYFFIIVSIILTLFLYMLILVLLFALV